MKTRRRALTLFLLLTLLLTTPGFGTVFASSDGPPTASVLVDISSGETAEVVIRLAPVPAAALTAGATAAATLKSAAAASQASVVSMLASSGAEVRNTFWLANAILARVDKATLDKLARTPGVQAIHPNYKFKVVDGQPSAAVAVRPATAPPVTWGVGRIGAPVAWDMGLRGAGVRVAVLDTGVDISHPDLAGKMRNDYPGDPTFPGGWAEFDYDGYPVAGSEPWDSHGHGTHTSGTVLGGADSGEAIGVAPEAILMHALALPGGSGYWPQIIAAMQWAVANGADVASMSFGGGPFEPSLIEPIRNMRASGVVPVVAIGNDGPGTTLSPGNVFESFAVGAINSYDDVAEFSGGNDVYYSDWGGYAPSEWPDPYIKPDFTAPGVDVLSAVPGGGYDYWEGTSMATPHVAGAIALLKQAFPGTPADVLYNALRDTAQDRGYPGLDIGYGHGIIDIPAALGWLGEGEPPPPPSGGPNLWTEPGYLDITVERGGSETVDLELFNDSDTPADWTIRDTMTGRGGPGGPKSKSATSLPAPTGKAGATALASNDKVSVLGPPPPPPPPDPTKGGAMFSGEFLNIGFSNFGELDWAEPTPARGDGSGAGYGFEYKPATAAQGWTAESLATGWQGEGYLIAYGDTNVAGYSYPSDGHPGLVLVKQETIEDNPEFAVRRVVVETADHRLRIAYTLKFPKHSKMVVMHAEFENIGWDMLGDVRYKRVMDWDANGDAGSNVDFQWMEDLHLVKVDDQIGDTWYTYGVAVPNPENWGMMYDRDLDAWDDYTRPDHGYSWQPDGPESGDKNVGLYFALGNMNPGERRMVTLLYAVGEGDSQEDSLEDLLNSLPREQDAPWLTADPEDGALDAWESTDISVTVDARGLEQGEYFGKLIIESAEPKTRFEVPVRVNVVIPVRWFIDDPDEDLDLDIGHVGVQATRDSILFMTMLNRQIPESAWPVVAITMMDTDQKPETGYTGRPANDIGADYMAFTMFSPYGPGPSGASAVAAGLASYATMLPGLDVSRIASQASAAGVGFGGDTWLHKWNSNTKRWDFLMDSPISGGDSSEEQTSFGQLFWLVHLVDDGAMNVVQSVGNMYDLTDLAPDRGHAATIPAADVQVSDLEMWSEGDIPLSGEEVSLYAVVTNLGDNTESDFFVDFVILPIVGWTDPRGTPDDPSDNVPVVDEEEASLIDSINVESLLPGDDLEVETVWVPDTAGTMDPDKKEAGGFVLRVQVDPRPREVNTDDNTDSLLTEVGVGVDVAVNELSVSSESVYVGVPYTLTATVENQGLLDLEYFDVVFYDGADEIGYVTVEYLAAEDSTTVDLEGWAPETGGEHKLKAVVEALPGEEDTDDNEAQTKVTATSGRDLAVNSLTADNTSPSVGDTIILTAAVQNLGAVDEEDIEVLLTVNGEDVGVSELISLAAGGEDNVEFEWTADAVGKVTLAAVIEPVAGETKLVNNSKSVTLTIQGRDLELTSIVTPSKIKKGLNAAIKVIVTNLGTQKEANALVTLEARAEGEDWTEVGTATIRSINPGSKGTATIKWKPQSNDDHDLRATVTPDSDDPPEVDTDNNTLVKSGVDVLSVGMKLDLSRDAAPAPGSSASGVVVRIQLRDASGNVGIEGMVVNLRARPGTLSASSVVTDENGAATVTVYPPERGGRVTVTATAAGIPAGTVKVDFPKVVPQKIKLVLSSISSPNGATIAVKLVDARGNPVALEGVLLALSTTAGTLSATSLTTNAAGEAQVSLTLPPGVDSATVKVAAKASVYNSGASANIKVTR